MKCNNVEIKISYKQCYDFEPINRITEPIYLEDEFIRIMSREESIEYVSKYSRILINDPYIYWYNITISDCKDN